MRLLRLMNDDFALEFHPYVTVVTGLDEAARQAVVDGIEALPRGEVGELSGLVESHGVVLDLESESLRLLEMDNTEVEVVVTADGLPGNGGPTGVPEVSDLELDRAAIGEEIEAAETEVLRQREAVEQAQAAVDLAAKRIDEIVAAPIEAEEPTPPEDAGPETTEAELDAVRALLVETESALAAAQETLSEAESIAEEARGRRDATTVEASALAGQLEAVQASLDPDADADLEAAELQLVEVREAVEQERLADADGSDPVEVQESIEHRLARLEVHRTELDAKLAVLGGAETLAVQAALEGLRGDDEESALVPSVDALELADEIERATATLSSRGAGLSGNEGTVLAARARLDAARQALADAEQRVRVPQLDRDDIDALEVAHADVLDAQEKSEGRFSKGRAERRLEEARAAEDAVLSRLGFDSYADYMMGTSMLHVDDEQEAALDVARAELANAEDAWAALQEGVDSTLEIAVLKDNLRLLTDKAAVLLGAPPSGEVVEALRAHRVAANRLGDAHGRLAAALQSVGLAVAHEDLETDDLVQLAEDWMQEEGAANELREAALAERAEVDLDLAETRSQLSQAAAGMSGPSVEDRRTARIDDAVAARDAAAERRRRHGGTVQEVSDLRAALAALTERVDAANTEAVEAEATLERARAEVADARATHEATALAAREVEGSIVEVELPEPVDDTDPLEEAHEEAIAAREAADEQLSAAREALALAEARSAELGEQRGELEARIAAERATPVAPEPEVENASAEEVEWYLLSRLAAQRRISFAGSVPMLIDRALDTLKSEEIQVVLDRLERMAAAVQLIVISDTDAARTWAQRAGEQRGAVVEPMKPADVVPFA